MSQSAVINALINNSWIIYSLSKNDIKHVWNHIQMIVNMCVLSSTNSVVLQCKNSQYGTYFITGACLSIQQLI